jgi:hypothetical protein
MISMLVRLSRLPVGSSASTISGSFTRARAMATRCCWPPESWLGVWCARWPMPTASSSPCAFRVALGRLVRVAVVEQGQLDVLERRRPRQQVEVLEHEPDLAVAQDGARVLVEARDVLRLQEVAARTSGGRAGPGCS